MIHIILNATKKSDTDCSGVVRAVAQNLLEHKENVLNVRFLANPLPHSRIGISTLVQVDTAADVCPTYLVKGFLFDPMHFLRERMFYRAHFKQEIKTYYVQEDVSLRSPVSIFVSQICEQLRLPMPALTMPTFKDNFFDSQRVRTLMQEQSVQFSRFTKSLSKEQKDSLPSIYHELDMDFLLDDWVGLVRYIEQRHIKIVPKEKEKEFVKPYSFLFNCTSVLPRDSSTEVLAIPHSILEEWGYTLEEKTKQWYCSEEDSAIENNDEYSKNHPAQSETGRVLLTNGEWSCV